MFAKAKYLPDERMEQRYKAHESALPGLALPWLQRRREAALKHFAAKGYPTTAVEAWKFSDVKPVIALHKDDARPHQGDVCNAAAVLDVLPPGPKLAFVNGVFNTSLSTLPNIAGVEVEPLEEVLRNHSGHVEAYLGNLSGKDEDHAFSQLNLAFAQDGVVVRLEEGVELEQPLGVAHIYTGGANAEEISTRNLFILKGGAKATVVEYTVGVEGAVYTANTASEMYLAGAAELTHVLVQNESEAAAHINTRYVRQEKKSQFNGVVFTTGARLSRVETQAKLAGVEADCNLHTVQLLKDSLHADSTTVIDHDTPEATSNQHCRMILDGHAKGAFQGKTLVARDAQQTDAHQLNKNLLLSRSATVNTKPELEIYADDVKCSHGATTGELDNMALFYLASRGVEPKTARRLLVEAFADEAIEEAKLDKDIKDVLRGYVAQWMGRMA